MAIGASVYCADCQQMHLVLNNNVRTQSRATLAGARDKRQNTSRDPSPSAGAHRSNWKSVARKDHRAAHLCVHLHRYYSLSALVNENILAIAAHPLVHSLNPAAFCFINKAWCDDPVVIMPKIKFPSWCFVLYEN